MVSTKKTRALILEKVRATAAIEGRKKELQGHQLKSQEQSPRRKAESDRSGPVEGKWR